MFNEFELTFTEICSQHINTAYAKSNVILEYGAGGSTLLAAKLGKTVITTETNPAWLIELMGAYKEKKLSGDIIPIYADIGQTKAWGYPVDDTSHLKWPDYAQKSWRYCDEHQLCPDLILIDGRFRVATFLACCASITKPTTLIFDDYQKREYYHIVTQLFEPVNIIDDRMAIFKIKPKKISATFILENMNFFLDPR